MSTILEESLLTQLAASNLRIEDIANAMRKKGYDDAGVNTAMSQIEKARSVSASVAQETPQVAAPQAPVTQQAAPEPAVQQVGGLDPDLTSKLAASDMDITVISNALMQKGYSQEQIDSITTNIQAQRSPQVPQQDASAVMPDQGAQNAPVLTQNTTDQGYQYGQDTDATQLPDQQIDSNESYVDSTIRQLSQQAQERIENDKRNLASNSVADLVAATKNIDMWHSDVLSDLGAFFGSAEADAEVRERETMLNNKIVQVLQANDVKNPAVANFGDETADGKANYGDILYTDEEGKRRIVNEGMLKDLAASRFEIAGGVGGASFGGLSAGLLGSLLTLNPLPLLLLTAGGAALGGGLGTMKGREADLHYNLWKTKQKMDGLTIMKKSMQAGVADPVYGLLGGLVGKGVIKGVSSGPALKKLLSDPQGLKNAFNKLQIWAENPRAGVKFVKNRLGKTDEDLVKMVEGYNVRTGQELDPTDRYNQIRAAIEAEPSLVDFVTEAAGLSDTGGVALLKQIQKERADIDGLLKPGTGKALVSNAREQLEQYGKNLSKSFSATQNAGSDMVEEAIESGAKPEFVLDIQEQVGKILDDSIKKATFTDADAKVALESKINELKRLTEPDTSEALAKTRQDATDFRQARRDELTKRKTARAEETLALTEQKATLERQIEKALEDGNPEIAKALRKDLNEISRLQRVDKAQKSVVDSMSKDIDDAVDYRLNQSVKQVQDGDVPEDLVDDVAVQGNNSNFNNLLELRKKLSALSRDRSLSKQTSVVDTINKMEKRVEATIKKTAKEYMGEEMGEEWFERYAKHRREWASKVQLERNVLYKEIIDSKAANYDGVVKSAFKTMQSIDRLFPEVADRLTGVQRRNLEKSVLNRVVELASDKDTGAINWPEMIKQLDGMNFRSGENKHLIKVAKKMSELVGNRTDLARSLSGLPVSPVGQGLAQDVTGRVQQLLVNKTFRKLLGKVGVKRIAFVDTVAKVLDNPLEAKSVKTLVEESKKLGIPEEETWSTVRQLQNAARQFGSRKAYGDKAELYYSPDEAGDIPVDATGLRKLSATEEAVGSNAKKVQIPEPTVAGEAQAAEIVGRRITTDDLRNNEVLRLLEENNINAVNIGNEVYLLPNYNP